MERKGCRRNSPSGIKMTVSWCEYFFFFIYFAGKENEEWMSYFVDPWPLLQCDHRTKTISLLFLYMSLVLLKVYCSDHTYTTIRIAVAATGRELISAVADKLGTTDELLLVHLSSAGGKNIDWVRCEGAGNRLSVVSLAYCPGNIMNTGYTMHAAYVRSRI